MPPKVHSKTKAKTIAANAKCGTKVNDTGVTQENGAGTVVGNEPVLMDDSSPEAKILQTATTNMDPASNLAVKDLNQVALVATEANGPVDIPLTPLTGNETTTSGATPDIPPTKVLLVSCDKSGSPTSDAIGVNAIEANRTGEAVDNSLESANSPTGGTIPVYSVNQLTPQTPTPWAFMCRVISRGEIREYHNVRGGGSLCEIYGSGDVGNVIRIKLVNDAVSRFRDIAQPGKTCCFSLGRIKLAAFSSSGMACEATFVAGAHIYILEPATPFAAPLLQFSPLSQVKEQQSGTLIYVAGVIAADGSTKRITTKKGKSLDKTEFALVDDSNTKVFCTAWGQVARECEDGSEGTAICLLDAQISEYNNSRSLNIGVGTSMLRDPAAPRSDELRAWFTSLPPQHVFTVLP